MAGKYYDSNAAIDGDGLTALTPRNISSPMGFTNTYNEIYIKAGSVFNMTTNILNAGGETNVMRILKYGTGANPILRFNVLDDGTGWQEVDPASCQTNTTPTPLAGTNWWYNGRNPAEKNDSTILAVRRGIRV